MARKKEIDIRAELAREAKIANIRLNSPVHETDVVLREREHLRIDNRKNFRYAKSMSIDEARAELQRVRNFNNRYINPFAIKRANEKRFQTLSRKQIFNNYTIEQHNKINRLFTNVNFRIFVEMFENIGSDVIIGMLAENDNWTESEVNQYVNYLLSNNVDDDLDTFEDLLQKNAIIQGNELIFLGAGDETLY